MNSTTTKWLGLKVEMNSTATRRSRPRASLHRMLSFRGAINPPANNVDDQFLHTLDHPMQASVKALREAILSSNALITEQVKWKAPSFCIDGDDRVTFRLPPKGGFQLIFHRGVKVKDASGFAFEDSTGLMQWVAADCAVVTLGDNDEVEAHTTAIVALVNRWMDVTSE